MKQLLVGLLLGMGVVMGVQAEDVGVNIDGKNISITKISFDGSRILHSKDLPDGIFIKATSMGFSPIENASLAIRKMFAEQGFKIADSEEKSSVSLRFVAYGDFDMGKAGIQAEHSDAGKLTAHAGAAVGMVIGTGTGVNGIIGAIVGEFIPMDKKASLACFPILKPIPHGKGFVSGVKDGEFSSAETIKYNLDKNNEASDDIVLKMFVNEWIKHYMVLDAEPSASAIDPVSAVAATN